MGDSVRSAMAELIAAAEDVARSVVMPVDGIDGGYVKLRTPKATRLINAVVTVRQLPTHRTEEDG